MVRFLKKLFFTSAQEFSLRERELIRRRRELVFAGTAFGVVLVLTWILFYLFDAGSALFITVFSLNFLLLLGVAVVVIRNGLKLVLERRRGVLGSRLRTRLTLAFVALTLAPCVLMFLITTKFVQLSVDFWFKDQITTSMETALEVGRGDYEKTGQRLNMQAQRALNETLERRLTWGGQAMDSLLVRKRQDYRLALVGLLGPDNSPRNWHASQDMERAWAAAEKTLNWDAVRRQGFQAVLESGANEDYVVGVLAVDKGKSGYIVLAESMGPGFKAKLERIASGATEYKQLWRMKRALKWMLYVGLSVLTLLIILGAVWFGFRVAKEISAPVLALADAAQRIARGDLSVRLDNYANDEMGELIRSFNRMAADLEASRERLTGANQLLEDQNRRIAEHSQYIETVLDNIASGVISTDPHGRINMVNKAACSILEHPQEGLVGHTLAELLPPEMSVLAAAMLGQFRRRPFSHWQRQITIPLAGQERRLLVNAVGLVTPEGENRGFVAVFEDVSEMEKMQRLAAWREVARRIAHEIKNPLTPIKLSAQRLQRKFGPQIEDPVFSQSTSLIVRQVEALLYMVQEFSSFAKLPEVDLKPGTIEPILRELVAFFSNSHSSIRWDLALPPSLPSLLMDKEALHRAFMNLFSNAVEALKGTVNGEVRISVAVDKERGLLRTDVADNGPGLAEEDLSRLFEPYYSRKKGGTGLGLTIVKSIVTDHKGYIRAAGSPKGGAVFTLELPL